MIRPPIAPHGVMLMSSEDSMDNGSRQEKEQPREGTSLLGAERSRVVNSNDSRERWRQQVIFDQDLEGRTRRAKDVLLAFSLCLGGYEGFDASELDADELAELGIDPAGDVDAQLQWLCIPKNPQLLEQFGWTEPTYSRARRAAEKSGWLEEAGKHKYVTDGKTSSGATYWLAFKE